jgi:putative ABC transport system permease protein
MRHLRYAARVLRHSPAFATTAVVVLAVGIGATSAIFSVVDAAVLRPLPFQRPGDLVTLWEKPPGDIAKRTYHATPLNFQDWHDQNTVFSGLAAVSGGNRTLMGHDGAEMIASQRVTREFFPVLGVVPVAGRTFQEQDERTQTKVVMVSERLWRTRFGGDPGLVGHAIPLDGGAHTVIGIVPAQVQVFYAADVWTLYVVKRSPEQRTMHYLKVVGRLKPSVTIQQASAAMAGVAERLGKLYPATNKDWSIRVEPLRDSVVGKELRSTTLVLGGVVAFVLLMACANVANLMLARAASRTREMAVRVALGAGRGALVRQLLAESVALAAMGGAVGLALAWTLIRAAERVIPAGTLPVGVGIALDERVTLFTIAIALVTGVLFGLAPAWQVSRNAVADGMRAGGRGVSAANSRLLGGLAMVEIAIAVLVVAGAGLFVRTLLRLTEVDPGYHAEHVLTARVVLPLSAYPTQDRELEFYNAAQREIEALPGVRSASFGGALPLTGWDIGQGFKIVGDPPVPPERQEPVHYQIVGARYFDTLGIPLLEGRAFDAQDRKGTQEVAIVNQEFVRRHLHGRRPVGLHLEVHAMDPGGPRMVEREIVGVVGQVHVDSLNEPVNALEVYVPITQNPWDSASIALRTAAAPETIVPALRAAVARVDRGLALTQVRTMDEIASESVARPRFRARLLGGFAAVALLLAAVGIFGVLAFSVTQRRREFGIRMAVGAQSRDVLGIVLARGLKIAAGGIALGLAGAAAVARAAATLLFDVQPLDAGSYGFAAALLAVVAMAAGLVPALRASRVDPAVTLREE